LDTLNALNPEQKKAVLAISGPVLILAGAGSGKTKTLTHRIAYMIEDQGIVPESILAVTFTNKAAEEMRVRAEKLINSNLQSKVNYPFFRKGTPTLGTFHSICAKILRIECEKIGFTSNFAIYDPKDQLKIVKDILKELDYDPKRNNPKTILGLISKAKNELVDSMAFEKLVDSRISEVAAKVYPVYQKTLKNNNAFDFDDLLMKTVELFQSNQEVLNYYQELWRYIHIDEYQDTNYAQYIWVKLLANKYNNICVVGDPDQSIYGWRGADIRNILSFEEDYKDTKQIKLEQNYRSTKNILKAAQAVISNNKSRKEKDLWTENEEGAKLNVLNATDEKNEGDLIIQTIHKLQENYGVSFRDIVILYRLNAQSRTLEEACLRYTIPYKIIGNVKFYDRKEIKDVLAYLKVLANRADNLSTERIINVPTRGIGKATINKLKLYALERGVSILDLIKEKGILEQFSARAKNAIIKFDKLMEDLEKQKTKLIVSDLLDYILKNTGYKAMLDDGSSENEDRLQNVKELLSVSLKYDDLEPEVGLTSFLEEISLLTDADRNLNNDDKVTLMTMHSAKGLEYEYVFIAGFEENIFPLARTQFDLEELEEERRLAYVSMTRAKKGLTLLCTRQRMMYGTYQYNEPSRFLSEIPQDLLQGDFKPKGREDYILQIDKDIPQYVYQEEKTINVNQDVEEEEIIDNSSLKDGDKVLHPTFGEGLIVSRRGGIVEISFRDKGLKKIALSIVALKKIS